MSSQTLPSWLGTLGRVMNIGIILLDSERNLSFANEAACELLGCADLEGLARRWARLRARIAETLEKADTDREIKAELQLKKGDAKRRLELEIELLPEEEAGGFLIIVKNKGLVNALEANLRYASKMRALARLFVSAAHDLKAPMNAISIHMELLKRTMWEDSAGEAEGSEKRARLFGTLESELQRLDRTLTDVLSLTHLPKDSFRRLDLSKIVLEAVALLAPVAREQAVTIDHRPGASSIPIRGHRDRFKQALLNICLNALEAMPRGGRLDIEVRSSGPEAMVRVCDTGPGIAPETLRKIWDLHFTTKEDGTGIGLHVSRTIIEALGGSVRVESEVGSGTCFTVTLPVAKNRE
jgi:signal transduction histidine kinase